MQSGQTNKQGQPFRLFVGFRETSWEVEYRRSVVQIATQTAAENDSALDRETLLHVVSRSIDHARAQLAIATDYAQEIRAFLNETFGLDLTITVGGYRQSGLYGRLNHPRTDEELVAFVERQMAERCGFIPDYATPLEGIDPLEWLLWCAETLRHPDPDYVPGDEVYDCLARRYRQTGAVLRHVRAALDPDKLKALLSRPVDAILERVLRG
ncbi:hypothetical protein HMPREF9695_04417 [Afipia broomeae ATCC 49717]|uniref:Uncharacterized protein n=1 Tax=Afipia broomeae ATCC 49717 TaxID=883078 RepID=K8NVZ3_9BRAD|nr:hypothetical protein HMPREF9695_04417 [Afipia broomeae ATCC 49717]